MQQGQRTDRVGSNQTGPVAHARLRRRARGASAHARQQAPGQDRHSRRRREGRRGQDRRRPRGHLRRGGHVICVIIRWAINPFRGDRFAEGWLPAAEAALDDRLDFIQTATFPTKAAWERYWYSETIAEKRVQLAGYYQVPLLPTFWEVVGEGKAVLTPAPAEP